MRRASLIRPVLPVPPAPSSTASSTLARDNCFEPGLRSQRLELGGFLGFDAPRRVDIDGRLQGINSRIRLA